MRVIFAPDSFKGSATAAEVARSLAEGWARVRPLDDLRLIPMADGGEGTLDAVEVAVAGSRRVAVQVTGPGDQSPDSRRLATSWLRLPATDSAPGGTGVVELASTSGISLVDPPLPLNAHTFGFGQAIAAALDDGVSRLLLALGGSASTDGGAGALMALGARLLDAEGRMIPLGGGALSALSSVDLTRLRNRPEGGALVLSDVTNPLLGVLGAASVFGEQKGANATERVALEHALENLANLLPGDVSAPGGGAGGGAGFGLMAWGADMASGAAVLGQTSGLAVEVESADIIVTGEGRFDHQSASGKVPSYVTELARRATSGCDGAGAGRVVMLVAGAIEAPTDHFAQVRSLVDLAGNLEGAITEPLRWLREAGASLAASAWEPNDDATEGGNRRDGDLGSPDLQALSHPNRGVTQNHSEC